jgi:ABC-type multidrug transport system ATPase subunit
MIQALETVHLSKRYGRKWALRDCTLQIPMGSIAGLIGPNGAGKTTLLHLATGLLAPSDGSITVLGHTPGKETQQLLPRIGFVSQEHPLYKTFTVREMLMVGQKLNRTWHQERALQRLERLGIPLHQQTGKLSGGQQAQVALILALAKQPELLILDEPVASLDPIARREFQQTLLDAVAEHGMTVLISSHIIADLERFCDYLVIMSPSHVQLTSRVDSLLQSHKMLVGPRERMESIARTHTIVAASGTGKQCTLMVQTHGPLLDPVWQVHPVSLEDIIFAYLSQSKSTLAGQDGRTLEVAQ